jgi:hypothetical protein
MKTQSIGMPISFFTTKNHSIAPLSSQKIITAQKQDIFSAQRSGSGKMEVIKALDYPDVHAKAAGILREIITSHVPIEEQSAWITAYVKAATRKEDTFKLPLSSKPKLVISKFIREGFKLISHTLSPSDNPALSLNLPHGLRSFINRLPENNRESVADWLKQPANKNLLFGLNTFRNKRLNPDMVNMLEIVSIANYLLETNPSIPLNEKAQNSLGVLREWRNEPHLPSSDFKQALSLILSRSLKDDENYPWYSASQKIS